MRIGYKTGWSPDSGRLLVRNGKFCTEVTMTRASSITNEANLIGGEIVGGSESQAAPAVAASDDDDGDGESDPDRRRLTSNRSTKQQQQHPLLPPSELMAKPVLCWSEFWQGLINIPESTAEEIGKSHNAPKFFLIGRRRFIRQKDALAWIDRMAEAKPYFPRRNNRKGAE